ncbi:SOH1-domain-containing protein [Chytriomyces sp. MP71]|nr:SOH1-domain-containing protein [Chytriomyces sp. MP71]
MMEVNAGPLPTSGSGLGPGLSSSSDNVRLCLELEFVQCLANPKYLQFLAQQQYFADPAFINYLKYLLYWRRPEYAKLIVYPYCLEMLDNLQHESFRNAVALEHTVHLIHTKEFFHWTHWRTNERAAILQQKESAGIHGDETVNGSGGDMELLSIDDLKAYLRGDAPAPDPDAMQQ